MIFARFMAIYGHKFKSVFETEDEIRIAKREWALSLGGFTEAELVAAINYCKESLSWMPTISEFLEIIRLKTDEVGVPNVRESYAEACRYADQPLEHQWSHSIVYWSGRAAGWFELRSETEAETFPRFRYQYELNLRKLRAGDELGRVPNPDGIEDRSEVTRATDMLSYAKENGVDEAVACKLLYYTTLPEGSRTRSRQYQSALQQAAQLNLKLPTTA